MKNNSNVLAATPPVKKRRPKSLEKRKARMGYIFVLPFLLGFLFIYLPMIVESLQISFSEIKIQPLDYEFIGFENYKQALTGDEVGFITQLLPNLASLLLDIPAIVIFSLFLAIILNQKMRGRAIFRAIFFIPVVVSTGIISYIDISSTGLTDSMGSVSSSDGTSQAVASAGSEIISQIDIQRFFANMAVGEGLVTYVTDLVNNVYDIINRCGVQMLIFLAGLQSISPAIYESAYMEGASSWETFWKITFPMISPMILVNAIYTVIDSFTAESNSVMNYIMEFSNGGLTNMAQGMAMSWMYFIVILLIIGIIAGLISAYVFYQRRD